MRKGLPSVAMDLDGVMADFTTGFTSLGNEMFGTPIVNPADQPDWSFQGILNSRQIDALWKEILVSGVFWKLLKPIEELDVDRINKYTQKNKLMYITNRSGYLSWEQSVRWLVNQGIKEPLVVVTNSKLKTCRKYGLTVAIEDTPSNLKNLYGYVKTIKRNWPYNKTSPSNYDADSLSEALDTLETL